jgi:hypothetical protein
MKPKRMPPARKPGYKRWVRRQYRKAERRAARLELRDISPRRTLKFWRSAANYLRDDRHRTWIWWREQQLEEAA